MEKILEKISDDYKENEGNVISILQDVQTEFGYIPEAAVIWFSKKLDIPASRFFGIATFYAQFHLTPRGKNIFTTCCGTACHVKGSGRLLDGLVKELDLTEGKNTTPDREFTLERVNCVGACSIAPVVIINNKVHGKMSADHLVKEIRKLKEKESEK
jgi:NADH:ubiquinone oxidoreductase subunit E